MYNYISYQQHEFSGKPLYKLSVEEDGTAIDIEHCHHIPLHIHV